SVYPRLAIISSLVLCRVTAAQQHADEEAGADRDQQRFSRIGTDIAAHLVGDLAEVDVVDALSDSVVLILHRIGGRGILVAGEVLRARETGGVALIRGSFSRFVHGGPPGRPSLSRRTV